MQATVDCLHCYLKQAVTCMGIAGINEEKQQQVLFELMDEIKTMDHKRTPAETSTELLLKTYAQINNNDPYKDMKQKSNALGLRLYPRLKEYLEKAEDRLYDALKISVAGNVIDLGINRTFDIDASLEYSLEVGFARDEYQKFINKLNHAQNIVIIGDNAGEIAFDKPLAEELAGRGKNITYLVKGGPILNDATMADAEQVEMNKTASVLTTGSNYLGAPLHRISQEALASLKEAELVISKGQANFESLEHEDLARDKVFFLLKIKCECIEKVAGARLGDVVFFTR